MTDITRQHVADLANAYMRNQANAGISWGTNSYPSGALAGWFAGPTSGQAAALGAGNFSAGPASASQVAAVLRSFNNNFAYIRRTRIVIYFANNTGEDYVNSFNTVQYDGTAIAFTAYHAGDIGAGVALPGISQGANMSYNGVAAACQNLYNRYLAVCRSSDLLLTNTVCHSSCHDNCHCARGRR
ncbi:hypothetical protein D3C81_144630 [compost metagenome]|jgi:hypothetical protein